MVEKVSQGEELSELDVLKEEIKPELSALEEEVLSTTDGTGKGKEKSNLEEYKKIMAKMMPEIRASLSEAVKKTKEKLGDRPGIREWGWAKSFIDDLGNDVIRLADEGGIDLYCKWASILSVAMRDSGGSDVEAANKFQEELGNDKETVNELKSFIDELCKSIIKYETKLTTMFNQGLKNNFMNVPEPMRSHFIGEKDKIEQFVSDLGRWSSMSKKVRDLFKSKGNKIQLKKLEGELENLLKNNPCNLQELLTNFGELFAVVPYEWEDLGRFGGLNRYKATNSYSIVDVFDKFPKDSCVLLNSGNFSYTFYGNKIVEYSVGNGEDKRRGTWGVDVHGNIYIKDDKGNIIFEDVNEGITQLDVKTVKDLLELNKDYLRLDGLKSIDVEVAKGLAKFGGRQLVMGGLSEIDDMSAIALIPIESKLYASYEVKSKISKLKSTMGDIASLMGQDLEEALPKMIWLADFKNFVRKTYGNKKVEYKRDFNKKLDFSKTFVVGSATLVARRDLENNMGVPLNDQTMEKILDYINDR